MGEGHDVDVAANGAVALDIAVESVAPDVILLDMRIHGNGRLAVCLRLPRRTPAAAPDSSS